MKQKNKILVTTTSSLEGWKIEAYLGTVISHIVAGTGLFSDLVASLSDVFGGRSQSYQEQLSAINEEAVESLKQKALLLGANCILGLKIDHDEISGKDKQMFMVTAIGTVVRAHRLDQDQQIIEDHRALDQDDFAALLKRKQIIRATQAGTLTIDDQIWNFAIANQMTELAPSIKAELERRLERQNIEGTDESFVEHSKEYFASLDEEVAKEHLYELLTNKERVFLYAYNLIGELNLLDIDRVYSLLLSDDFELRKRALQLLVFDKPKYKPGDIDGFEKLLPIIQTRFAPIAERITEKAKLSSKVKEFWKCECGEQIEINHVQCYNCYRDMYGFKGNEIKPEKAIALVSDKIGILKERFIT